MQNKKEMLSFQVLAWCAGMREMQKNTLQLTAFSVCAGCMAVLPSGSPVAINTIQLITVTS